MRTFIHQALFKHKRGNRMMLLKKPEGCAVQLGMMVQFCFANELSGCC